MNVIGRVVLRVLASLARRAERQAMTSRFAELTASAATVRLGSHAEVINHGARENIKIHDGVLLDGVIECYESGCLEIGDHSYIGRSRLFIARSMIIGRGVLISDHCIAMDSDLHPISGKARYADLVKWTSGEFPDVYRNIRSGSVVIGDYAWIGANCVILKGVSIGEGAIVGAGSIVTKDVPPYTVVAGNPARVIRKLDSEC